jgi:hypothetical protein
MHLACLLQDCLASNEQKTGGNCSWHDFASSILTSRISALCLYGPRKSNLQDITFFCPAVVAKNSLNASQGSALNVLCHLSLCANFDNKTLLPIMTPLPRNQMLNT